MYTVSQSVTIFMLITYVKKVKGVGLYNYTVWKVGHKVRNILYRDGLI